MTSDLLTDRRTMAEHRLLVICTSLEMADEELGRAKADRDWEVFDLPDWEAYCAKKLPQLKHIKLRAPERQRRIKALLDADPNTTEREAAASTGSSAATAHRDFLAVTGREPASNEAAASPVKQPVKQRKTDRVVAYLASHGPADVKAVTRMLKCERHEASATLTRLVDQRRIAYTAPEKRGSFGTYSAGE